LNLSGQKINKVLAIQKSQIANLKRFLEFARGGAIVHKEVVADYAAANVRSGIFVDGD